MSTTTPLTPRENLTKYLAAIEKLASRIFSLGEDEGYQLRTHERDLESDGNWVWGKDSREVIVLRHKGEDCPDEILSELMLHLLAIAEGLPTTETPVIPETPEPAPKFPFLQ